MIGTLRATEQNDLPTLAKFLVRVYKFEPSDYHADPRLLEWKYLDPRAGWVRLTSPAIGSASDQLSK